MGTTESNASSGMQQYGTALHVIDREAGGALHARLETPAPGTELQACSPPQCSAVSPSKPTPAIMRTLEMSSAGRACRWRSSYVL